MSGIKRCLSIAAFGMLFAMIFIDRKGIGKVMQNLKMFAYRSKFRGDNFNILSIDVWLT